MYISIMFKAKIKDNIYGQVLRQSFNDTVSDKIHGRFYVRYLMITYKHKF